MTFTDCIEFDDLLSISDDDRFTLLLLATSPDGSIRASDLDRARQQLDDYAAITAGFIGFLSGGALPVWNREAQALDFVEIEGAPDSDPQDTNLGDEDDDTVDLDLDELQTLVRYELLLEAMGHVLDGDRVSAVEVLSEIEPTDALAELANALDTLVNLTDAVLVNREGIEALGLDEDPEPEGDDDDDDLQENMIVVDFAAVWPIS